MAIGNAVTSDKNKAPPALVKKAQALQDTVDSLKERVKTAGKHSDAAMHLVGNAMTVQAAAAAHTVLRVYTPEAHVNKVRLASGVAALAGFGWSLNGVLKGKPGKGYAASFASGLAAAETVLTVDAAARRARATYQAGQAAMGQGQPAAQPAISGAAQPVITPAQVAGPVRDVLPEDPALAEFRARGLQRARGAR